MRHLLRIGIALGLLASRGSGAIPALPPPKPATGAAIPADRSPADPEALFQNARPAVVILRPINARGGGTTKGTGFLISSNGLLVTARHVTTADTDMFALTAGAIKYPVTGYVGEDADHDIAVVKIDGRGLPCLPLAAEGLPQPQQWVGLIGNPGGGGLAFPTGQVVGVSGIQDVWEDVLTSIPVRGGHSGSPVLNNRGEVAAIAIAATEDQKAVVIPIKVVKQILARADPKGPAPYRERPRSGPAKPIGMDPDFRAAQQALQRRQFAVAEKRLLAVNRRFPRSPAALLYLGYTYLQRQAWSDALPVFKRALQSKPDSPALWFFYGSALVRNQNLADGITALKKAIAGHLANPGQLTAAWSTLATVAAQQGRVNDAREALTQVRQLDPNQAEQLKINLWRLCPRLTLPPDLPPEEPAREGSNPRSGNAP